MLRGDIYFINRTNAVGTEIAKSRPAIIVSNNVLNTTSEVVEVVYLTTQPKKEMPTHVILNSTGVSSVALCEQVDHVYKGLVGSFCARCTAEELEAIDKALMQSLGLDKPQRSPETETEIAELKKTKFDLYITLEKTRAERDTYKELVNSLTAKVGS